MPFTDEQFAIAEYLGLPFTSVSVDLVQGRLDAITDEEFVTAVQEYLSELDTIEGAIATKRDTADPAIAALKTEARKYAARLALALDLEVRNDVF